MMHRVAHDSIACSGYTSPKRRDIRSLVKDQPDTFAQDIDDTPDGVSAKSMRTVSGQAPSSPVLPDFDAFDTTPRQSQKPQSCEKDHAHLSDNALPAPSVLPRLARAVIKSPINCCDRCMIVPR
ncbi:MAG: hypothetical protein IT445_06960 [Phycisphaeraceae bacterium]|nr:hypothetical protein [Phycisphaeraceae bacterium]